MITKIRQRYRCTVIDLDKAIETQFAENGQSAFVIVCKDLFTRYDLQP